MYRHIKQSVFLLPLFCLVLLVFASCDMSSMTQPDAQQQGQQYNNVAADRGNNIAPPYQVVNFTARKNINERYKMQDNAALFGYFYGFVQGVPQPVIEYVVKGPILPVDDAVTPPNTVAHCSYEGSGSCGVVVSAPQPDGTYNTNGTQMFGWTADGTYFEWQGPYAYSTHPLAFRPLVTKGCVAGAEGC